MQDGEQMCRYRIVQDGLPLLLPYVTRQLLQPTVQELLHLIEDRSLYVPEAARAAPAAPAAEQVADQVMREANTAAPAAGPADGQADATVKKEAAEKPADVTASSDVTAEDGQAHVEGIGHTVPWHHYLCVAFRSCCSTISVSRCTGLEML